MILGNRASFLYKKLKEEIPSYLIKEINEPSRYYIHIN